MVLAAIVAPMPDSDTAQPLAPPPLIWLSMMFTSVAGVPSCWRISMCDAFAVIVLPSICTQSTRRCQPMPMSLPVIVLLVMVRFEPRPGLGHEGWPSGQMALAAIAEPPVGRDGEAVDHHAAAADVEGGAGGLHGDRAGGEGADLHLLGDLHRLRVGARADR